MRIAAIEPVRLHLPLKELIPPRASASAPAALDLHLVRVASDEGTTGWGEARCRDWEALGAAVSVLAGVVRDQWVLDRGALWERMVDRLRRQAEPLPGGAAALSALDQALWHLAGVELDLPVYQLLGGRRMAMLDTCAGEITLAPIPELLREVEQLLQRGFRALRMRITGDPERDLPALRAVKELIGPQVRLMVNVDAAWPERDAALRAGAELDHLELFWLAEPLPPTDWADWVALRSALDTPIAGGRDVRTPGQFRAAFAVGALDIATPDVRLCGGISGLVKIADLARWFSVQLCPANAWSLLGTIAAAHAAVTFTNCQLIEVPTHIARLGEELLTPPPTIRDGFLLLSDEPGLGVGLKEDLLARYRVGD